MLINKVEMSTDMEVIKCNKSGVISFYFEGNPEVCDLFSSLGNGYNFEKGYLFSSILRIFYFKGSVTYKDIVIHLIEEVRVTTNIIELDILRNVLEAMIHYTHDGIFI